MKKVLAFFEKITIIKIVAKMSGDDGEEVTPVPIPNTEVKLFSADGSWGIPPVRVGRCQADHIIFGPLVKRLRHRPFTAVTRVRIPYGSP